MQEDLALVHELMEPYLPEETVLTVQCYGESCSYAVIMYLTYTSKRSGRKLAINAKGSTLPTKDDETLQFYVKQLVLSPAEILKEFSRLYFMERKAKQDAWLSMGKSSRREDGSGDTIRISDNSLDRLIATEFSAEAAADEVMNG